MHKWIDNSFEQIPLTPQKNDLTMNIQLFSKHRQHDKGYLTTAFSHELFPRFAIVASPCMGGDRLQNRGSFSVSSHLRESREAETDH